MSNITTNEVIKSIRERRKYLKISQRAMSEKLHISLKAYQNLEIGLTKVDIERLQQIATILSTDLISLLNHNISNNSIEQQGLPKTRNSLIDKDYYISYLEESLLFYRNLIKENNLMGF